jgi:hypothetical protein
MQRDGYIVDNPKVGSTLATAYWKHGNDQPFLKLIHELTGKELSGEAWVSVLKKGTEEHLQEERRDYQKNLAELQKVEQSSSSGKSNRDEHKTEPNLNMTIRFVDGDVLIADSSEGGVLQACHDFESYVLKKVASGN